jgi:hypothetical protein
MGKMLAASIALALTMLAFSARAQDTNYNEPFSPDQLDNLTAPIALYPDPLLAQVLVAATFPDQIDEASRFLRSDANPDDIDGQPWDVSVKAVAHYPETLALMADKLDWTTSLGQAYVGQPDDVMDSVQRLRAEARSAGNLANSPEMEVVDSGGEIEIWPAQPEYIYVPVYNPEFVYVRRAPLFFHTRFLIGAWLALDFDWRAHHIFYHGWEGGHGGWIDRSRPHIRITDVYVNRVFRNVVINRTVINRQVNYGALNRYADVHPRATFDNFRNRGRVSPTPPATRLPENRMPQIRPPENRPPENRMPQITPPQNRMPQITPPENRLPDTRRDVPNKIIERNINTGDPRIDQYRGRPTPTPNPPATRAPQPPAPVTPAFTPDRGGFDPRQASRRGEISRERAAPHPSAPPPPPQPTPPPARHEDKKKPH